MADFEWKSKSIHVWDIVRQEYFKVSLEINFNIPKCCRTVVTNECRVFCIGGRLTYNKTSNWMMEYLEAGKKIEYKSPMKFMRANLTALYCELGFIFVIGGVDNFFYKECEKYDI